MTLDRRAQTHRQDDTPKPRPQFNESGAVYLSDDQDDTAITREARDLVKEIKAQRLSPCDAVYLIALKPDWFRDALGTKSLAQWSSLEHFSLWPQAWSTRSIEEWTRSLGNAYPWIHHKDAWLHDCQLAQSNLAAQSTLASERSSS